MVDERRPRWRLWRLFLFTGAFALLGLSLFFLLRSCGSASNESRDPFSPYRPALKAEFQSQLEQVPLAPRYAINVQLDALHQQLQGSATVLVANPTIDPWPYLIFRLYPVLEQYRGAMTMQGIAVDDQPMPFVYEADNTAIRITLPQPLEQGDQVRVRLAWKLTIPQWPNAVSVYALFGQSQDMTSLPLFYPTLAVYLPGPTLGTGHWWLDEGTVRGDAAFNVASLFVVTATLPANEVPVTSGTLVTSTLVGANQARHVWVTGPVREFLLHMSPSFHSAYTETYGTRVTSYWIDGQEAAGREALTYAIAALRIYSDRFGPYPFRDLRVAPAPLSYRGMEYPQALLLGPELYTRLRNNLEVLVAHEVAHQWWYQVVHNDPVNEPWLDEALAEYSVKIYMEELHGKSEANQVQFERWQIPINVLKKKGIDPFVDQTVASFESGNTYEAIVYGKGALFYDALRDTLGERQFFRFLHNYLEKHRYQIVTTADWEADLAALNNPAVDALYKAWIKQPMAPATQPTPEKPDAASK
jgi:hypothetical protein